VTPNTKIRFADIRRRFEVFSIFFLLSWGFVCPYLRARPVHVREPEVGVRRDLSRRRRLPRCVRR
jgi:hypothetical protein